jgi:hypothetical protein
MSMRYPNITTVKSVINTANTCSCGLPDGRYVPARPLGFMSFGFRCRAAWLVFTGKADALLWEGQ